MLFRQIADKYNKEPLRAPGSGWRVSSPASLAGSMTVEAALALPLFIFFFCNILGFLDMIRLQCVMFAAVRETGTKLCEYAYYLENAEAGGVDPSSVPEGISSLILSETFVRSDVQNYLGEDYLHESPILGDSISFLQSDILGSDDLISIVADYRVEPFISVIAPESFALQTRFVGHAWIGYEIAGSSDRSDDEDDEQFVYITPTGEVYHKSSECTYLKPRIRQTTAREIGDKRSSDGSCYYACESCHPTRVGTLYYTPDGNRYHSSPSCPSIKRTAIRVRLSEVEADHRACSKCGNE